MKCGYRGWIIDATPNFSLGKFFAHARLVHVSGDENVGSEIHIERDIAWFDTENEAIEVAQEWAFAWICERDGRVENGPDGPPTSRSDISTETPGRRDAGYILLAPY